MAVDTQVIGLTVIKFCIIVAFWTINGKLITAILAYCILVALPLLLIRALLGLAGVPLSILVLTVVGLDLLVEERGSSNE